MAATLIIVGNEKRLNRSIVAVSDIPGRSTPLYLGSKYDGTALTLTGWVKGLSYDEAKTYLETLEANFKAQEEWNISGWIGKTESFSYSLRPGAKSHRVSITLRKFD